VIADLPLLVGAAHTTNAEESPGVAVKELIRPGVVGGSVVVGTGRVVEVVVVGIGLFGGEVIESEKAKALGEFLPIEASNPLVDDDLMSDST
jgi:hypothetical protein